MVDEYYRDGLAINRQLAKIQRAEQLGISARLNFSDNSVAVSVTGPVEAPSLSLLLSHPLESDRDFQLRLQRTAQGRYRGTLTRAVSPRWHWTLELPEADGWRLDGSVTANDFDRVDSP